MAVDTGSIKGILTGKVGGVPVVLIAVAGIGGLAWYLSRKPSTDSTDETDAANGPASTGLDFAQNQLPTISNTYINVPQPPGTATTPTSPSTGTTTPPASNPVVNPKPLPVGTTPGTKTGTPPKQTSKTYVVKAGDNLTKIAKAEGVSLSALENANKTTIARAANSHGIYGWDKVYNYIYKGEKLVIPS